MLERTCSFGDELKNEALLAFAEVANDAAILDLARLQRIRGILQSPHEPVVMLVDADPIGLFAEDKALLIGLPNDALAIGFALKRMKPASGADEPRRTAVKHVALYRDPSSRRKFLAFIDAKQMSAPGRLAMQGDVGMEIVFAQAKAFAKIAEGFGSLLAFWHGSGVLPFRRLAHFPNTIPPAAHDGVLKVAAEAETLSQPTAVLVFGNNRNADDEGFRAHEVTLTHSLEMSTPHT